MAAMNAGKVKTWVREAGADLVGIASAEAVTTTRNRRGPRHVMPGARAIVVFARPMLQGSIESPRDEVVTTQNLALYAELDRIAYSLGCFLEREGFQAALVPAYSPVEMTREAKGLVGVVSLRHAAQAAGLGALGRNNLLLTPELGPRVRLGGVVTDAPFQTDAPGPYNDLCADCEACVEACPVEALSEPGKTRTGRCLRQALPYGLNPLIRKARELLQGPGTGLETFLMDPQFWNFYQSLQLGLQYGCHACITACPAGKRISRG